MPKDAHRHTRDSRPIRDVEQNGSALLKEQRRELWWCRREHHNFTGHDEQTKCGQQTQGTPRIEQPKRDRARTAVLVYEQRGDEKTAENEENVDAEIASDEPAGMSSKNGNNRHGPQAIKRGEIAEAERLLRGEHVSNVGH